MNRYLYLVRHAQTHIGQHNISDKVRELTQEGVVQAQSLGKCLAEANHQMDVIISSNAERAKSTALLIASSINYPIDQIKFVEKIYSGVLDDHRNLIRNIPDTMYKVMMVGHYPTILELHNYLTHSNKPGLSTCELNVLEIKDRWQELTEGGAKCMGNYIPTTKQ